MKQLLLICVSAFLLLGCGQKGSLYFPLSDKSADQTMTGDNVLPEVVNE